MFIFSWIWVIADLSRSEEFNKHGEKENRAFRSSSFLTPKKQLTGFAWNFLETPIQVCRGVSILYFNIPFIFFFFFFFLYLFPVFWGHLNPHVRINKKLNSVAYHPGPSRLVSKIHPFISLRNSLGLYLSLECLLNFVSNLYIPPCVGNIFKFIVFTFLENALNLVILLISLPTQNSPPSSCHYTLGKRKLLITPGSIFWKICLPQQQKEVEELLFAWSKFSQKKWRWLGIVGYLYFVWFVIFSNVKLEVCRLKWMINKELLAQFIYKPA